LEDYSRDLDEMLPNNRYGQIAVFEDEECLGLTGFWIGTKLWCGKYLEIDNLVVSTNHRSKGAGKLMFDYLAIKAKDHLLGYFLLLCFINALVEGIFETQTGILFFGFFFCLLIKQEHHEPAS
jgi:hypothetical protein